MHIAKRKLYQNEMRMKTRTTHFNNKKSSRNIGCLSFCYDLFDFF
jgi:hypothetical protein